MSNRQYLHDYAQELTQKLLEEIRDDIEQYFFESGEVYISIEDINLFIDILIKHIRKDLKNKIKDKVLFFYNFGDV